LFYPRCIEGVKGKLDFDRITKKLSTIGEDQQGQAKSVLALYRLRGNMIRIIVRI